jgi:hypothetical protein
MVLLKKFGPQGFTFVRTMRRARKATIGESASRAGVLLALSASPGPSRGIVERISTRNLGVFLAAQVVSSGCHGISSVGSHPLEKFLVSRFRDFRRRFARQGTAAKNLVVID